MPPEPHQITLRITLQGRAAGYAAARIKEIVKRLHGVAMVEEVETE